MQVRTGEEVSVGLFAVLFGIALSVYEAPPPRPSGLRLASVPEPGPIERSETTRLVSVILLTRDARLEEGVRCLVRYWRA
jgi:hypothetical protein